MSRIGKAVIPIPSGVIVARDEARLCVRGPKGEVNMTLSPQVELEMSSDLIVTRPAGGNSAFWPITGTTRANIANMVVGVSYGYRKKLVLVGVGYRAQVEGSMLVLALGFSHPIKYQIPADIKITAPTSTEVIVEGAEKQKVGQVAAEIRAYRRPEPYKGKGVRYDNELVLRKEAKKK
jgi:large subunit ribosomal protein L6